MPDQDQPAALSGLAIFDDVGNGGLPGQMTDGFGLHALGTEIVRHSVKPGREHSEPAAQEIDLSFGLADAAPKRRNGHAERA
jgi:hypothetical protein